MTPVFTPCASCHSLLSGSARFCPRCGMPIRVIRSSRPSTNRPLIVGLLMGCVAALFIVSWFLFVPSVVTGGGSAAIGAVPIDESGKPPRPTPTATPIAVSDAVGGTFGPRVGFPPAGLRRYDYPTYSLQTWLPREWQDVSQLPLGSSALGDLSTDEIEAIAAFAVDARDQTLCMIGTDRRESPSFDVDNVEARGSLFIRSKSSSPDSEVRLQVETIAGRVAVVSDIWREDSIYMGVVVVPARRRAFYFASGGPDAASVRAAHARLRSCLEYLTFPES